MGTIKTIVLAFISVAVLALVCYNTYSRRQRPLNAPVEKEDSIARVYKEDEIINGHKCVDLGLSVRWATCNVGASSPEDYGDYYAWGETKPKSSYDEDNSETYGKSIGDIKGTARDVAYVKWGGTWRMPTRDEFEELINNCEWEWTVMAEYDDDDDGMKTEGYKVSNKSHSNSIFLPAAAFYDGQYNSFMGSRGSYWCSTPADSDGDAYYFDFYIDYDDVDHYDVYHSMCVGCRVFGQSVRPVTE